MTGTFNLAIGDIRLFATVRMFVVGKITGLGFGFIELSPALYVRDLGNFDTFFKTLKIPQYRPLGTWTVATGALQGWSQPLNAKVLTQ